MSELSYGPLGFDVLLCGIHDVSDQAWTCGIMDRISLSIWSLCLLLFILGMFQSELFAFAYIYDEMTSRVDNGGCDFIAWSESSGLKSSATDQGRNAVQTLNFSLKGY